MQALLLLASAIGVLISGGATVALRDQSARLDRALAAAQLERAKAAAALATSDRNEAAAIKALSDAMGKVEMRGSCICAPCQRPPPCPQLRCSDCPPIHQVFDPALRSRREH